jgi:hypothetical protein
VEVFCEIAANVRVPTNGIGQLLQQPSVIVGMLVNAMYCLFNLTPKRD